MYTSYKKSELDLIFKEKRSVYFIGIGGISMSSLASIAMSMGLSVGGYDRTESHITKKLENEGAVIYYELSPSHIENYDVIIYTAAIAPDNEELAPALEYDRQGKKFCIYRADFLGWLMSFYKNRIGISGMHGKSTATSMLAHIFLAAELDPTVVLGAELEALGGAYKIGSGDSFIMEACEYQDSFLSFTPNIAVVLNIDMDHPDYFRDISQIITSFRNYMAIAGDGYAVVNADNENVRLACEGYTGKLIRFGYSADADFRPENINYTGGKAEFDIIKNGEFFLHAHLGVSGEHNIMNALATTAAADICHVHPDAIARGLEAFTGAKRRMELRGYISGLAEGVKVPLYDDYAHHPTEIRATVAGALKYGCKRVFVVFQPHTYSRTHELFNEFAESFDGVNLILADIYAAREKNVFGVSSEKLAAATPGAVYLPSNEKIAEYLRANLRDGDMLIVMGAGDIIKLDELLL